MSPNPRGQIINRERSGGLGVCEMWCKLFRDNEIAVKEKRWKNVQTDKQLASAMQRAFPDRHQSVVLTLVQKNRGCYNRGMLFPKHAGRGEPPPFKSHRYTRKNGRIWLTSPRGRLVKELEEVEEKSIEVTVSLPQGGQDEKGSSDKGVSESDVIGPKEFDAKQKEQEPKASVTSDSETELLGVRVQNKRSKPQRRKSPQKESSVVDGRDL